MTWIIILIAVGCLAFANGANDNFKGVATLFGSGTTNYRGALTWATIATFLGSLTAVFLAAVLLKNFSGKGLVDDALASTGDYRAAVAAGAGLTVLLATRIGMPISTTHSLVGALVGAGWAAGSTIDYGKLNESFFLPLIASPILALVATSLCYPILHYSRRRFGISEQTCFCVGTETVETVPLMDGAAALLRTSVLSY
jgi:PiT family inorganic phosphate transporter